MKRNNRNDSKLMRRPSHRKVLSVVDGVRSSKKGERQSTKKELVEINEDIEDDWSDWSWSMMG